MSESIDILNKYKKILNTPIKISFMGKTDSNNKEKETLIKQYLEICNKYIDMDKFIKEYNVDELQPKTDDKISNINIIKCNNCDNAKNFDNIDNIFICLECGSQQELLLHNSNHKDIDRINISVKYTYDRRTHFRDTVAQFQGRQNSNIPEKIYIDLENQLKLHNLLINNTDKIKKFENITKEHIFIFLKDLGYSKHYENVNLIHYNLTGKVPDDISHLEDKLLDDFDRLTDMYDKKYKNKKGFERKNFINTQFILFLLLNRHCHPCKKENFTLLKTIDRREFHYDIMKDLFASLGWTFTV